MTSPRTAELPSPLRTARVLMCVVAALSALWALAVLVGYGATAENLGVAMVTLLPGAASLALALRMSRGGNRTRIAIIVLEVLWILLAFGRIGQGDGSGLIGVIVPAVVLYLVTRPQSRDFFAPRGYF